MLRIAATGEKATPPLFETMEVLGRDLLLSRLDEALAKIKLD
jgi:glutamyl/glutaminyl-tRNA synthetase